MKNILQAYWPSYLWFSPPLILGGSVISAGTIHDLRRVKVPGTGPLWNPCMCLEYFNTCQHLSCNNDYFCAVYFNMHPVSFVWIKSCSNSNNFSLCICAKYQLFFLSIVISFQSKCLFLLTIMTLVSFRHMFIILTRMISQKKNQELLSFHHHFIN